MVFISIWILADIGWSADLYEKKPKFAIFTPNGKLNQSYLGYRLCLEC